MKLQDIFESTSARSISLLQEASDLPLSDLKKTIQKDKRVSLILKRDSVFSDIKDVAAFVSTIKFLVLNNRNVMAFVKMRGNVKDIHSYAFETLRKAKPEDFKEEEFDLLKDLLGSLFKEHTSVQNKTLSREARKEIDAFVNSDGVYHDLKSWVQREIASVPGLRPDKKVTLYRGLLFKEYSLKETNRYDGTLEKGSGIKFLEAIREGSRIVDLEWDRASSWTTSKEVAEQFAKYGPASSNYAAQMMWFDRQMSKREIDGVLGFVISTLADPKDILLDVSAYKPATHHVHGDEGEMILRPGKYLCRINKKFTVEGEVDPVKSDTSALPKAIDEALLKIKDVELPPVADSIDAEVYLHDAFSILRDPTMFQKLTLNETTESANQAYNDLMKVYRDTLHHLTDDDTRADTFIGSPEMRKKASTIAKILQKFRQSSKHQKFAGKGGHIHALTGSEFRTTVTTVTLSKLEQFLGSDRRVADRSTARAVAELASALGVQAGNRLHLLSAARQSEVVDEVVAKFFSVIKVTQPESQQEAIKTMLTMLKKAYRNFTILQLVKYVKTAIENIHHD